MEGIVLSHKRPDVAVALLLQVLEEGRPATAAFVAAATWRRARPEALLCVFHWLMCTGRVTDAASLVLELIQHGKAPVVADLLISLLEGGNVEEARDITAVLIAKGHAAEVAQQSLWMVRAGRAQAVAQIRAALVQSGGLALACDAQNELVALDEMAAAVTLHHLIRMGHVDVAARMVIHLVDGGHVDVVCKWLEGLERHVCHETLLQLSITIAKMGRPDAHAAGSRFSSRNRCKPSYAIMANWVDPTMHTRSHTMEPTNGANKIKGAMVELGHLDLAKRCMVELIKRCHPWANSAIKVEMVRQGKAKAVAQMAVELSKDGEDAAPIEGGCLGQSPGAYHGQMGPPSFYEQRCAPRNDISMAQFDDLMHDCRPLRCMPASEQQHIAPFWCSHSNFQRPVRSAERRGAQKQIFVYSSGSEKALVQLVEVMLKMVEVGEAEAAAELLAELAKYAPTVACDLTIQLAMQASTLCAFDFKGHSDTAASLLLRLLDTENTAAVVIINNYIIESGHIEPATTLASAMAARTDVLEVMETLKAAGAHILLDVWHRETSRYICSVPLLPFQAPRPIQAQERQHAP
ncbi:hypothetical protein COCOBI_19-1460 [Coccomyxa sp. Obi]|nr:hypothetical protein COCOBI_19-1460 [Coccomyxa sp. Obi]